MRHATRLRPARPGDEELIVTLVRELATYERAAEATAMTPADVHRALFSSPPAAGATLAELDGLVVGMALWFPTFSTWTGRQGMHLEDLYVRPQARRLGIGRALLEDLGRTCRAQGLVRLEWAVLEWNTPAQAFYRALGAAPLDEWRTWRLDGAALASLGAGTSAPDALELGSVTERSRRAT